MYTKNVFNARFQDGKLSIDGETNKNGDIKKFNKEYSLDELLSACTCSRGCNEIEEFDEDCYDLTEELDRAEFDHYCNVLSEAADVLCVIGPEGYNNTAILDDVRRLRNICIEVLDAFATYIGE